MPSCCPISSYNGALAIGMRGERERLNTHTHTHKMATLFPIFSSSLTLLTPSPSSLSLSFSHPGWTGTCIEQSCDNCFYYDPTYGSCVVAPQCGQ